MPRFVEDEGKKKKERVRRRKSKRRKKRKEEFPSTTSKATVSPTVNKEKVNKQKEPEEVDAAKTLMNSLKLKKISKDVTDEMLGVIECKLFIIERLMSDYNKVSEMAGPEELANVTKSHRTNTSRNRRRKKRKKNKQIITNLISDILSDILFGTEMSTAKSSAKKGSKPTIPGSSGPSTPGSPNPKPRQYCPADGCSFNCVWKSPHYGGTWIQQVR